MIEVVCAVLLDDTGPERRILAARRPEGAHLGGCWELPGGKVEDGETPEDALRREILEELGCRLDVGRALGPVEHEYAGRRRVRLQPFLCRVAGDDAPRPLHHTEIRWLGPGQLDDGSIEWAAADRPILAEVAPLLAAG